MHQVVLVGFCSQRVSYPQHQLRGIDRLGEEIHRPHRQRLQLRLRVIGRRQHDDRDIPERGVGAHPRHDFEAAYPRHVQVEQQDVRPLVQHQVDGRRWLAGADETAEARVL